MSALELAVHVLRHRPQGVQELRLKPRLLNHKAGEELQGQETRAEHFRFFKILSIKRNNFVAFF